MSPPLVNYPGDFRSLVQHFSFDFPGDLGTHFIRSKLRAVRGPDKSRLLGIGGLKTWGEDMVLLSTGRRGGDQLGCV